MAVAAVGHFGPSSAVRARAVFTVSTNDCTCGCDFAQVSAEVVSEGTLPVNAAIFSWLAGVLRHSTSLAEAAILALSPVLVTLNVSPPSGETTFCELSRTGIGTLSK